MILSVFVLSLLINGDYHGSKSIDHIVESKMYGIEHMDKVNETAFEEYAITLLDSIFVVTPEGVEYYLPRIDRRYRLNQMPCVRVYHLQPGTLRQRGVESDPARWVLFNKCDTTFNYFGNGIKGYCRVLEPYLRNIESPKEIVNTFVLYLNTISARNPYYLIESIDSFDALFDDPVLKGNIISRHRDLDDERLEIANQIKPSVFTIYKNSCKIELYTWEYIHGYIDHWIILYQEDSISIVRKKRLIRYVGPYLGGL